MIEGNLIKELWLGVFPKQYPDSSWTAYQVATKPAKRKVWRQIPTRGPWREIDLRKYFTNK